MKKLILTIAATFLVSGHSYADSSSGAIAGSQSQSGAAAGAGAIAITNIGSGPTTTTTDPQTGVTTQTTGGATSPFASGISDGGVGGIGVGLGGSGGSAHNAGNKQSITFNSTAVKQHKNTPSVVAPALSSTLTDTCMGSITGGAAAAGWGISGGKTYVDEECVRRLHSKFLASAGQGEIAMQLMCGSPMVAEAAASLAERTEGVDACTGTSYAAVIQPIGPADEGVGPVPLLGPDVEDTSHASTLDMIQEIWEN